VDHTADWWLGDLMHPWFLELEHAINDEWGVKLMCVQEGSVHTSLLPHLSTFTESISDQTGLYCVYHSSKNLLAVPEKATGQPIVDCKKVSELLHVHIELDRSPKRKMLCFSSSWPPSAILR
jgi:hypothetical protein